MDATTHLKAHVLESVATLVPDGVEVCGRLIPKDHLVRVLHLCHHIEKISSHLGVPMYAQVIFNPATGEVRPMLFGQETQTRLRGMAGLPDDVDQNTPDEDTPDIAPAVLSEIMEANNLQMPQEPGWLVIAMVESPFKEGDGNDGW